MAKKAKTQNKEESPEVEAQEEASAPGPDFFQKPESPPPASRPWIDECPHCHAPPSSFGTFPPGCKKGRGRRTCTLCGKSIPFQLIQTQAGAEA